MLLHGVRLNRFRQAMIVLWLIIGLSPVAPLWADVEEGTVVTLDLPTASATLQLDPALAASPDSLTAVENLFLGLTDIDPITNDIQPELATSWTASEDYLTWTFTLRDDVKWQHYDPATGQVTAVRQVVAGDVIYSIQRACDPRLGSNLGPVLARLIDGCDVVNSTLQLDVTDAMVFGDMIQVSAPDDTTVIITLQYPAQHFLSITPMIRPVMHELIEGGANDWTAPGHLITNGPYFLHEYLAGVQHMFVINEQMPADLRHGGNIERIVAHVIPDSGTRLSYYDDHLIDQTDVDPLHLQRILGAPAYSGQVERIFNYDVYFFGFAHRKQPFDDAQVRRAFSAIIDRQAFVEQNRQGRGIPMIHLTPPGVTFAPDLTGIGVGFDPDYARRQMAAAGYPNCEGFPRVQIVTLPGAEEWGDFLVAAAETHLGCDPAQFSVESVVTPLYTPELWQAHIWTAERQAVYPDVHNWLGEVLDCTLALPLRRSCTDADLLLRQAAREPDPLIRTALYAEIESAFFGPDGEFPIAPLFVEAGTFFLVKPWLTGPFETDGQFGGVHWDAYQINMREKEAARP